MGHNVPNYGFKFDGSFHKPVNWIPIKFTRLVVSSLQTLPICHDRFYLDAWRSPRKIDTKHLLFGLQTFFFFILFCVRILREPIAFCPWFTWKWRLYFRRAGILSHKQCRTIVYFICLNIGPSSRLRITLSLLLVGLCKGSKVVWSFYPWY